MVDPSVRSGAVKDTIPLPFSGSMDKTELTRLPTVDISSLVMSLQLHRGAVDQSLDPLAGHYGGIVRRRGRLVHCGYDTGLYIKQRRSLEALFDEVSRHAYPNNLFAKL